MPPIEGHQTPMLPSQQQLVPATPAGQGTIPLTRLVDFLLQKTYTELCLLADLLPRKTDMERKIEIANFAHKTRQQFIRLLALIKWAASANKVEKCAQITAFLDKQSMLFVETADMLALMARDTLVHARLPSFHIPSAVEVLTLGTYSRLPACIREKIVPPDPITPKEKKYTLSRLNQIIEYRLVSTELPPQMRNLEIGNGRVTFLVEHEFKVSLTLMGDGPNIPWRLLDVIILVEDKETGDGKPLVHSLQIQYLQELIQSRMIDNPRPLHDLYSCLHSFCLSLQLEVLNSQVIRLAGERLGSFIHIEEYTPCSLLQIAYWIDFTKQHALNGAGAASFQQPESNGYKLAVVVEDPNLPLQVRHTPVLQDSQQADQAIRSDRLSVEKLLVHTIHLRTRHRLTNLRTRLSAAPFNYTCVIVGTPSILQVSLFVSCVSSENLLITVDTHTGMFLAHVPQYEPPMMDDIQEQLNKNLAGLEPLLIDLKYWIVLRRCEKTIQHLPLMISEQLPLVIPPDHPLKNLSPHRLYLKLCKHQHYYIAVELKSLQKELAYYLMSVEPVSDQEDIYMEQQEKDISDDPAAAPSLEGVSTTSRSFFRVVDFLRLDAFAITHGPCTQVQEPVCIAKFKRKILSTQTSPPSVDSSSCTTGGPPTKKARYGGEQYLPELAHIVAMCDETLPFTQLDMQLLKHGVCHQGVQVEAFSNSIRIVKMPDCEGVDPDTMQAFHQALLSTSIHLQGKGTRAWLVEFVFGNCPIVSLNSKESGPRRPVTYLYEYSSAEGMVQDVVQDWTNMARLYHVVLGMASSLQQTARSGGSPARLHLSQLCEVRSYTYKRLVLGYGSGSRPNTVTIYWRPNEKRYHLSFAVVNQSLSVAGSNPHTLIAAQLQHEFNEHCSISTLMQVLYDTYNPLLSISKLPSASHLCVIPSRPQVPVQSFVLLPQTSTHYRLVYRQCYCIDIHCRQDGLISIKDGAYSVFDKGKAVEELAPIQVLRTFLNKFVDDPSSHNRRRSHSDDDNPLSPSSGMESLDSFLLGQHKPGSPAAPRQEGGLRFHLPMTPPSGSNPHTPASPHPSVLSQQASYGASPNPSFSLASPPPQQYVSPSPSMLAQQSPAFAANSPVNPIHVPSPSFLPTASPSAPFGGHGDGGSPFPSPAAWPGSPSVPRPSPRSLGTAQSPGSSSHPALHSPQAGLPASSEHSKPAASSLARLPTYRTLSATQPMLISHKALDIMCTPSSQPHSAQAAPGSPAEAAVAAMGGPLAPLERLLGCAYMRRSVSRFIQTEETLTPIPVIEPGAINFKVETLQFKINFNIATLQSLHIKVIPTQEYKDQWSENELQVIERYFDLKVLNAPYKPNAFLALTRLMNAPIHILKSCLHIFRLEMITDRSLKWSVQWCLTIPPAAPPMGQPGMSGVMIKEKMLFFLQLTRIGLSIPASVEPQSIVVPIVYEMANNTTLLAADRNTNLPQNAPLSLIRTMLKRFSEHYPQTECSIYPAIRELMANLVIPL